MICIIKQKGLCQNKVKSSLVSTFNCKNGLLRPGATSLKDHSHSTKFCHWLTGLVQIIENLRISKSEFVRFGKSLNLKVLFMEAVNSIRKYTKSPIFAYFLFENN